MNIKNLFIILFFTIHSLTAHADYPIDNKKNLKKYFKIAAYSTELLAALISYPALQCYGWNQEIPDQFDDTNTVPIPTLKAIVENAQDKDAVGVVGCTLFQVPFLATMFHAVHGLYTAIAPAQNAQL